MIPNNFITSANELPGYRITRNVGIVRGITVRSRSIVGTIGAGLQSLFGGNITLWTQLCEHAREEAFELMSQHARSGMKFAGKVSQLITASTGLDNWEWGVTLWARNPTYLKDIVYTMRFDESSAKYALFGEFYFGYILPPDELLETIRL